LEAAAALPRQRVRIYVRREEIPGLMRDLRAVERWLITRLSQAEEERRVWKDRARAADQLDWISQVKEQQQQRRGQRGRA
jgi:hypothetical protein